MKKILLPFLFLTLLIGCGPKPCTTCNGTGKITSSTKEPLSYEIVNKSFVNTGVFNPDYTCTFKIKNTGEKAGKFIITCSFLYNDIGEKKVSGEVFIPAYQIETATIRYDADKIADSVRYEVIAPEVIVTHEEICPKCNGKGVI